MTAVMEHPPNFRDLSDDVSHLLRMGESLETIATRLGIKPASVSRSLYRHGHPELARPFGALARRLRRQQY